MQPSEDTAQAIGQAISLLCTAGRSLLESQIPQYTDRAGFADLCRVFARHDKKERMILTKYINAVDIARDLVSNAPDSMIGKGKRMADIRLIDIQALDTSKDAGLRRGLCQISLALDLCDYEIKRNYPLHLGRILQDLKYSNSKKGKITEYLGTLSLTDGLVDAVRKAITNGLKILWLLFHAPKYPRLALIVAIISWRSRIASYEELSHLVDRLTLLDSAFDSASDSDTVDMVGEVDQFSSFHQFVSIHDSWLIRASQCYDNQCDVEPGRLEKVEKRLRKSTCRNADSPNLSVISNTDTRNNATIPTLEYSQSFGTRTNENPKALHSLFHPTEDEQLHSENRVLQQSMQHRTLPEQGRQHSVLCQSNLNIADQTLVQNSSVHLLSQKADISPERIFNQSTTLWCLRPYNWPIFEEIFQGQTEAVVDRLRSRTASIYDVDPYSLGLPQYAAYYCCKGEGIGTSLKMCRALADLGADLSQPDEIGNSAIETLIDNAIIFQAMKSENIDMLIEEIASISRQNAATLWSSYLHSRQFSVIHEIILGIRSDFKTIDDYASLYDIADVIDAVDSRGRTALTWAAEYGWSDATEELLRHGASPQQMRASSKGCMPLLHLVIAGANTTDQSSDYLKVIDLLLYHGADVNQKDHEGWTAYHVAASWHNFSAIKRMSACAEIDWKNTTDANETAVQLADDNEFFVKCIEATAVPVP